MSEEKKTLSKKTIRKAYLDWMFWNLSVQNFERMEGPKFSGFSRQHAYAHYCLVPKDAAYCQVRISWGTCSFLLVFIFARFAG